MKKFISLLLAFLLAFTVVACSDTDIDDNNDKKEKTEESASTKDESAYKKSKKEQTNSDEYDELSLIRENGKLKIGYTIYSPMNYIDDEGNFVGFDTEYAKAVCKKLGVEPEFIEINWNAKEIELNTGNIDCIWNGFTINDERKEQVDFSTPYIKNKQVVVIKKENAEKYTDTASLSDANLTAETISVGEGAIVADENLKKATYTAVEKQTDALLEVASGTSDAAVLDYTLAFANVGKGNYTDLMIIDGLDLAVEEYGIGFRKGSSLTQEVNKITAELIKDGTMDKIAEKYELSSILNK